jgi:thiamine biosynthesis protein ThiS
MKVIVNKKQVEIENTINIYQLLELLNVNPNHCAVAVGNKVIKKSQWSQTQLNNDDEITIINATCGG